MLQPVLVITKSSFLILVQKGLRVGAVKPFARSLVRCGIYPAGKWTRSSNIEFFNIKRLFWTRKFVSLVVHLDFNYLDSKLNFESHISHICKKTGNHLNVLKRPSKFINKIDRMAIFSAFILCHFQFSSVVWHFCGLGSMTKMEKYRKGLLDLYMGTKLVIIMVSCLYLSCPFWNLVEKGALQNLLIKLCTTLHPLI